MIELSRSLAQLFRNVVKRFLTPPGRRLWPSLAIRAGPSGLEIWCAGAEVVVRYHDPTPRDEAMMMFSAEHLAAFAGAGDVVVRLEESSPGTCSAGWVDRGGPHSIAFPLADAKNVPRQPVEVIKLSPMPAGFVRALHDAFGSAARDATRYALHRIQLRGASGEIVATDGKQLLFQAGFEFPFEDNIIMPALPVFGLRELQAETDVKIGRSKDCIVIAAGCWHIELKLDVDGRFPMVDEVVPKGRCTTEWTIDPLDADFAATRIRELPIGDETATASVTLDIGERLIVRAANGAKTTEIALNRSPCQGRSTLIALEQRLLLRTLALGFQRFQCFDPRHPIIARDGQRRLIIMPLEPNSALPTNRDAMRLESTERTALAPVHPTPRRFSMARNSLNGHTEESTDTAALGALDPMSEAESLRGTLQEAQTQLGRLMSSLKSVKRQRKALESAMTSLRQLELT